LHTITGADRIRDAVDVHAREVVSIVGGGGKTTLMFALAHELMTAGQVVVTTTTTKIFPPSPAESSQVIVSCDTDEIIDLIEGEGTHWGHVTVAREVEPSSGKLCGIDTELVRRLSDLASVTNVIVEADGAAGRSLKAPDRTREPVIPSISACVIPVIGIDVVGCEMSDEFVFRAEIATALTGMARGDTVSPRTVADLVTHDRGMVWNSPDGARVVPFINKVDGYESLPAARMVAEEILSRGRRGIDRVVLGHVRRHPPVTEVISK